MAALAYNKTKVKSPPTTWQELLSSQWKGATPFVARFTGLPGELGVRVRERHADGTVLVEPMMAGVLSDSFLARSALPGEPVLAGEGALMMIRPTGVRLCDDGRHLSGRVTDVAFRGRGYEHAIDINEHTRLTGVFSEVRAARGETVGLRLDPAGCHVFATERVSPLRLNGCPPYG
jgi:iron(III) transport system ATP-binding protein